MKLLTMARAEKGLAPLKNQEKKHFWRHPKVFLRLLQPSMVLWTALMVVQNKSDPEPGLTPSIPAQLPLDRQESSRRGG